MPQLPWKKGALCQSAASKLAVCSSGTLRICACVSVSVCVLARTSWPVLETCPPLLPVTSEATIDSQTHKHHAQALILTSKLPSANPRVLMLAAEGEA